MKIFLSIFILFTSLFADVVVTKSVSVNQASYPSKSNEEIKSILLKKAKLSAANEIFGDFVKRKTVIENGELLSDAVVSQKKGLVHLQGSPYYSNGKDFGDLMVTIKAYATDKEIAQTKVHKFKLKGFRYTNSSLAIKELKKAAKDAFLVEIFSQNIQNFKKQKNKINLARKLAISLDIVSMKLDVSTSSYTISGGVEYIPYFTQFKEK